MTRASLKLRTSNRQRAFSFEGKCGERLLREGAILWRLRTLTTWMTVRCIDLQPFSDRLPVLNQNYSDQVAREFQAVSRVPLPLRSGRAGLALRRAEFIWNENSCEFELQSSMPQHFRPF